MTPGDDAPLYGSPMVSVNSLVFFPRAFRAISIGDSGPDLTDGRLSMMISSTAGEPIGGIRVWERGDYSLAGVGTAVTQVSVGAQFFVEILEVNGQPINPIGFNQAMVFSPKPDGTFTLPADSGLAKLWSGEIVLDVAAALADAGIQGGATLVSLSLDNTLFALSEPSSVAFIAKKVFGVEVLIPEPSTLTLFIVGCFMLLTYRRRPLK